MNLSLFYTNRYTSTQHTENKSTQFAGITLGLQSTDYQYNYDTLLSEIKATGSPWICLSFKFYQNDIYSNQIEIPDSCSAKWQQIKKTVQQAKAMDFKVALLPIVLLKNSKPKEWRGVIQPKKLNKWFKSYQQLLVQISNLAQQEKVNLLFIGSEFSSLQHKLPEWTALITTIRKHYYGKITYSANWDALADITFANQLDILGINGYFSLTKKKDPTVAELTKAWQNIQQKLQDELSTIKVPIFFSELGYASQNGINRDPWNYTMSKEVDLQEQLNCFLAFNEVWLNSKHISGVFFYEWFGTGGDCDTGYTPRNKPAMQAIKQWFVVSKTEELEHHK